MDFSIFNLIHGLAGKWWVLDYVSVFIAAYFQYFLVLTALFLIFKEKKWRNRIYFFSLVSLSLILSRGIITEAIKFFVNRPRPFSTLGINPLMNYNAYDAAMSFPSGHATFFFALGTAIFLFYWQAEEKTDIKIGIWFLAFAFLISLARIFVGIHWPSDILVGGGIGILCAYLVKKVLDREFKIPLQSFKSG